MLGPTEGSLRATPHACPPLNRREIVSAEEFFERATLHASTSFKLGGGPILQALNHHHHGGLLGPNARSDVFRDLQLESSVEPGANHPGVDRRRSTGAKNCLESEYVA